MKVGEQPLEEELRAQRGCAEIEALDAQTRKAEQNAEDRRDEPRADQRERQGKKRNAQQQIVSREGPNRHERSGSQGHQPGVTRQKIESEAGQTHHDCWDNQRIEPIIVADERDCGGDDKARQNRETARIDRRAIALRGMKRRSSSDQTLAICSSPNSPDGRISKKATARM